MMPSSHLILCHPLLPLPSVFPRIRAFFQWVDCIRWPKYWSFNFSISSSKDSSVLISFRIDWFYLHSVQGNLKRLLQLHNSKESILQCSAFFVVQLSYPWLWFSFCLPSDGGEGNGNPLKYSRLENLMDGGAWWATVQGVTEGWTWQSDFTFIFHFHALEKEMAAHSRVLAWRVPGTGEPGGLPSMGSHRIGHDWSGLATAAYITLYITALNLLWSAK